MDFEIKWKGSVFREQIESDFFEVFKKITVFGETPSPGPVESEPTDQFREYQSVHDELAMIKSLSSELSETVDRSGPSERPLILPSGDQIARIPSIVAIERLSMSGEIEEIQREAARTAEIVQLIEERKRLSEKSKLFPLVLWAGAGAFFLALLGRTR
jgi:hypothetical protein